MANSPRKKPKRNRPLKHFYLDGKLHQKLSINRGQDTIIAWCYPDQQRKAYSYSDVKARKKPAFSTGELSRMLGRNHSVILRSISEIGPPQYAHPLKPGAIQYKRYYWSEEDVMRAHEYFASQHIGRPRLDGQITNNSLPSPRELRAMMRQEQVFYVKNEDGEFVPTWRAPDFT